MFELIDESSAAAGVPDPAAMAALSPPALVAAVESSYRMESMLVARRLAGGNR